MVMVNAVDICDNAGSIANNNTSSNNVSVNGNGSSISGNSLTNIFLKEQKEHLGLISSQTAIVDLARITPRYEELMQSLGFHIAATSLQLHSIATHYATVSSVLIAEGNQAVTDFTNGLIADFFGENSVVVSLDKNINSAVYKSIGKHPILSLSRRTKSVERLESKILSYELLNSDSEQRVLNEEKKQLRYDHNTFGERVVHIQDAYGVRLVARSWDNIYNIVLPYFKNNFNIIDEKDYTGKYKKANGYEAVHINIEYFDIRRGVPIVIEVQLRDKKADLIATEGSASDYHNKRQITGFVKPL